MEAIKPTNTIKYINCIRFSSDENILKLFKSLNPQSRKHILLSYFKQNKFNEANDVHKLTNEHKKVDKDRVRNTFINCIRSFIL